MNRLHRFLLLAATGLSVSLLSQCSSTSTAPPAPYIVGNFPESNGAGSSRGLRYNFEADSIDALISSEAARTKVQERPGLGTQLGREIYDSSNTTRFFRSHSTIPNAVAQFYYNDKEGAETMSRLDGAKSERRKSGAFDLIPGRLRATVLGGSWRATEPLPYLDTGKRVIVMGEGGDTYAVRLENLTKSRMEVVMTVDGLDVLDGQPGSVSKYGYVIEPKRAVVIEGMKVKDKMHAFQFGTVADSQAAVSRGEKGARNVGVIGTAIYLEDEAARRRAQIAESQTREEAKAFGQ
ncbi:MAG: hypothetical protein KDK99_09600 [Verrucomicrobiales bacterium]|nr:hypothetical protein [Verrucomicrobiales bacterium]